MFINIKHSSVKILSNDKKFIIRWNWGYVLTFLFIWSYGFENVEFSIAVTQNILITLALILILAFILIVSEKFKDFFAETIQLTILDCLIFFLLCIFFLLFSIQNLTNSLVGDQLYHAQASQSQSFILADNLISIFQIPLNIEYKLVVWLSNLIMFIGLIGLIYVLKKSAVVTRYNLIIFIFGMTRIGFMLSNVLYADPHPPFRLFPLWLGSIFFGLNDVAFRLCSLFSLVIFSFFVYKLFTNNFNKLNSILLSLSVSSIPLLWHVSCVVEQSIWSGLAWSFILLSIEQSTIEKKYIRWISIISIASLMRVSSFVGLVPIFVVMILDYKKIIHFKDIIKYLILVLPILVFLPFLYKSLTVGTPSTSGIESISLAAKLIQSITDGFSIKILYYNILVPWIFFLPLIFIDVANNWKKLFSYVAFFGVIYLMFYNIKTDLFGVPRYQAEIGIPFVILGFYKMANLLNRKFIYFSKYIKYVLIILIAYNTLIFSNLNWLSSPVDEWNYFADVKTGRVRILSEGEGVYNTREALLEAKKEGFAYNECKAGITYGTFSEVMSGYTIGEMIKAKQNFPACSTWESLNMDEINKDQNIRLILFIDRRDKIEESKKFIESGKWLPWKNFYNEKYGSTIIGIKRSEVK